MTSAKQSRTKDPRIRAWRAANCWTGSGLEHFPDVEQTLESLYRRLCQPVRGEKREGALNTLITYFHRGFIPINAPSERKRQRGTAIIADPELLKDLGFLQFLSSLGEWHLLRT